MRSSFLRWLLSPLDDSTPNEEPTMATQSARERAEPKKGRRGRPPLRAEAQAERERLKAEARIYRDAAGAKSPEERKRILAQLTELERKPEPGSQAAAAPAPDSTAKAAELELP